MNMQNILDKFEGVVRNGWNRWKALCPLHQDRNPSLAIHLTDRGTVAFHCHGPCGGGKEFVERLLEQTRLEWSDLYSDGRKPGPRARAKREKRTAIEVARNNFVYSLLLHNCPLTDAHHHK
jgi:hypothetical protein